MKAVTIAAAFLLVLSGCDDRERLVKTAVQESLRDPDSAKFSEGVTIRGRGESLVACGYVNAKNAFGGYVGDNPYMVWQRRVYLGSDSETALNISLCCYAIIEAQNDGKTTLEPDDARVCNSIGSGSLAIALLDDE